MTDDKLLSTRQNTSASRNRCHKTSDLFDAALRTVDVTSERATTAIQRLLVKVVCERDISAQEVCHHLLELPMVLCSRQFHILAVDGRHVERELLSEQWRVQMCHGRP